MLLALDAEEVRIVGGTPLIRQDGVAGQARHMARTEYRCSDAVRRLLLKLT